MPLSRPLAEWPLILCGPILRRVEPKSVSVFVVLKFPRKIYLSIYSGNKPNSANLIKSQDNTTIALGKYFHVSVVTVELLEGEKLQPGITYGYDLAFEQLPNPPSDDPATSTEFLSAMGELQGDRALWYDDSEIPTFALPPDEISQLRILHASCRLPHAEGREVFPTIDKIIHDNHTEPLNRPHQLFLTGDQIYADDVAPSMLRMAADVGQKALGWSSLEPIPGVLEVTGSNTTGSADTNHFKLAPERREKLLKKKAGFTSGAAGSHLISLAEYYGMYLLVWADEMWPRNSAGKIGLPGMNEVLDNPKWHEDEFEDDLECAEEQFKSTNPKLQEFSENLYKVRRFLANVPTYMIFDDHEVTDDWYIHQDWESNVFNSLLGRRILQNALSAYVVFQAWGNDYRQFQDDEPGGKFLDRLSIWDGSTNVVITDSISAYLGLPSESGVTESISWDYHFTFNKYQVIVLDTRTLRGFPEGDNKFQAAKLLNSSAVEHQIIQGRARKPNEAKFTLLVSPAPVIGHPFVEEIIQPFLVWLWNLKPGTPGPAKWDFESWVFHRPFYEEFLKELTRFQKVIILSGDVHYGFSATMQYWDERVTGNEKSAIFAQLTASGLRNETCLTRTLGSEGFTEPTGKSFLGWDTPGYKYFTGSGSHRKKHKVNGIPALLELPLESFEERDTFDGIPGEEPKWSYRINFIKEKRNEEDREIPSNGSSPSNSNAEVKLASTHRRIKDLSGMNQVVGHNNFGEITFENEEKVSHSLWFVPNDEKYKNHDVLPYTKAEINLRLPAPNERPNPREG